MKVLTNALYGPIWLSWIATLIGTALFGGPLLLLIRATDTETLPTAMRWSVRGASFGIIVLPLALWLYAIFYRSCARSVLGISWSDLAHALRAVPRRWSRISCDCRGHRSWSVIGPSLDLSGWVNFVGGRLWLNWLSIWHHHQPETASQY